jgi:hypothetical protein
MIWVIGYRSSERRKYHIAVLRRDGRHYRGKRLNDFLDGNCNLLIGQLTCCAACRLSHRLAILNPVYRQAKDGLQRKVCGSTERNALTGHCRLSHFRRIVNSLEVETVDIHRLASLALRGLSAEYIDGLTCRYP